MSNWFELDATQLDELQKAMEEYSGHAGPIIDEVLHGEGEQEIERNIKMILPRSGRKWKGKKTEAASAQPFSHDDGNLSVTVTSRGAYHYLYFPDDGGNTRHHQGNQQFMKRGAENASSKIIELCVGKLTENFEQ